MGRDDVELPRSVVRLFLRPLSPSVSPAEVAMILRQFEQV
jgi:hypothetical protein